MKGTLTTSKILILSLAFIPIIGYSFLLHDRHIDWRVKLMHPFLRGAFFFCGMYSGGDFNRKYWEAISNVHVKPNTDDEKVITMDIQVPFQLPHSQHNVLVRMFAPRELMSPTNKKLPLMIYSHSGGTVIGNATALQHQTTPRYFVEHANMIVLSVDYRLAPEHPFPEGLYDVFSTFAWLNNLMQDTTKSLSQAEKIVQEHTDVNKIIFGGECAGASLTMAMSYIARDKSVLHYDPSKKIQPSLLEFPNWKLNVNFQMLAYPYIKEDSLNNEFNNGYLLNNDMVNWFWNCSTYRFKTLVDDYEKSPLLFPHRHKSLRGLPDALVMTPMYSRLNGDGKAYTNMMRNAGVDVTYVEFPTVHSFFSLDFLPESTEARELATKTFEMRGLVGPSE